MTYFLGFIIGFIGLIFCTFIASMPQVAISPKKSSLAGIISPLLLALTSTIFLYPENKSMGFWGHLFLIIITLIPSFFFMVSIFGKDAEERQSGSQTELTSIGTSGSVNINFAAGLSLGGLVSVLLYPIVWYFIY